MTIIATQHHTIMQKHRMFYLLKCIKFIFLLTSISLIGWVAFRYKSEIVAEHSSIMYFIIVPFLFVSLNYIFIKLILETIIYYHDLVIFYRDKIVIIKNSLFYQSDLEIIDVYRIQKLSILCHGIFPTLIGYGNIRIEQQNDDVKVIHFVPRPERIVELLEIRRATIISERGKKEKHPEKENYWERG